ncbi:hypothetical protein FQR65_LT05272 [Abscondita terminalis]|nr:hypothetical protein FQR65_LT05272 [Abscondita terminalis]
MLKIFPTIIKEALREYDLRKGIWRWLFGDAPAIKRLRKLNLNEVDELQALTCFIGNMPNESKASYYVYNSIFPIGQQATECLKESFNAIKEHNDLISIAYVLSILKEAKLLTQESFNAVKEHNDLISIAYVLSILKEAKLLTQESFNAVKEHNDLISIAYVLFILKEAKLLTQKSFNAIKEHNDLISIAYESFNAVKEHNEPIRVAYVLSILKEAKLLTQENFNTVKKYNNPSNFVNALYILKETKLLTQRNFTQLLDPRYNTLLRFKTSANVCLWDYLPRHLLTQTVFTNLITLASQANPTDRISEYINLLLLNGYADIAGINNNQSTHTASIHQTVSTSALKLMSRYKDKLPENKVEEIISTIKDDISKLPTDTLINKAAKNCIERISQLNFADPDSKITVKQLLALSYLARHDDDNRQGCKEDANQLFIEGLYEIQRGYNITANGVDSHGKDKPICTAGTFNKLMEKLCGVHPDVELNFITKEIAAQKLPIIVKEEVKNYLEKLSKYETKEDFHSFITLLKQLLKEGIEIIWNKIKPKVTERLFDEFKSIYNSNKENSDFLGLVNAGQDVEIEDLVKNHQQQIEALVKTLPYNGLFFRQSNTLSQMTTVEKNEVQSQSMCVQ